MKDKASRKSKKNMQNRRMIRHTKVKYQNFLIRIEQTHGNDNCLESSEHIVINKNEPNPQRETAESC